MKTVAIIPARYASTRFPGKPLALLDGKPIIQRVYERVSSLIPDTYVATDDARIQSAVQTFGGQVIMTSPDHQSGTDRCEEAVAQLASSVDVVLNIQGDEPFVQHAQIEQLLSCFDSPRTDIATLGVAFGPQASFDTIANPNSPKVVLDSEGFALYFSRSVIPYLRGVDQEQWAQSHPFIKHLGMYGYRRQVLARITQLSPSVLERCESLEQLRWLEAGYKIKVALTQHETIGIDTPEDLLKAQEYLQKQQ
ncbi:MAG: 3-deoxy-manno-octulosonate cytidylyltransferase [Bacteroidaceae bacterium]|nr:3-deoxy-manno-octulosonate cytidylyltransferase [Bacteroidaceae bacterium]